MLYNYERYFYLDMIIILYIHYNCPILLIVVMFLIIYFFRMLYNYSYNFIKISLLSFIHSKNIDDQNYQNNWENHTIIMDIYYNKCYLNENSVHNSLVLNV